MVNYMESQPAQQKIFFTSTPKKNTPMRARVTNLQECLKEHMNVEGTAVASIASTLKEVVENAKDNSKVLAEMNGDIRRVYKAIEKLTEGIAQQNALLTEQNDDKRKYHIEKKRNAVEKTQLKKKLLEIKEKQLELQIKKND